MILKKTLHFFFWFFVCILFIFLYYFVANLIALNFGLDNVVSSIVSAVVISILSLIFLPKIRVQNKNVKMFSHVQGYFFIVFFVFLFVWFAGQLAGGYILGLNVETGYDSYKMSFDGSVISYVLLTLIFAPVAEEFLFRGVCYSALKNVLPKEIACVIVSCIFAICHGTLVHLPACFLFSVFLCALCEYYGNLIHCICFHVFYNFLSFTSILNAVEDKNVDKLEIIFLCVFGLFLVGFLYFISAYGFNKNRLKD